MAHCAPSTVGQFRRGCNTNQNKTEAAMKYRKSFSTFGYGAHRHQGTDTDIVVTLLLCKKGATISLLTHPKTQEQYFDRCFICDNIHVTYHV